MQTLITEKHLDSEYQKGATVSQICENISDGLRAGHLKPEEISIKALWNKTVVDRKTGQPCGWKLLEQHQAGDSLGRFIREEGSGFVNAAEFSNISAQLFYHKVLDTYKLYSFPLSKMFDVVQSNILTSPERMAGISEAGAVSTPIGEGQEIPTIAPMSDYIDTPPMQKIGKRIMITREALATDRVGQLLMQAKNIGISLAHSREYEAAATLADLPYTATDAGGSSVTYNPNRTTGQRNSYKWRDVEFANYESTASPGDWINSKAANALVDHEQINQSSLLLDSVNSPFSGFPLATPERPPELVCTQALYYKAKKVQHSTWYRSGSSSNFGTVETPGNLQYFDAPFTLHKSKHLKHVLDSNSVDAGTWYFGYLSEAFGWRRYMDFEFQEMLPNSGLAFTNDIVMGFRCLDFQTAFTLNPRFVIKNLVS